MAYEIWELSNNNKQTKNSINNSTLNPNFKFNYISQEYCDLTSELVGTPW